MKRLYIFRHLRWTFIYLSVMAICLSSCIDRDMIDCETNNVTIKITAASIQGLLGIEPEKVTNVRLYIFENDGKTLLETINTQFNVNNIINHPGKGKLYAIATANTDGSQTVKDILSGDEIVNGKIQLGQHSLFDGQQLYNSPDDLLWGDIAINNEEEKTENIELPVRRIIGRVVIRVSGIQNLTRVAPDNVSVVLGTPHHTFTFDGRVSPATRVDGINAYYKPSCGSIPNSSGTIVEAPDPTSTEEYFNVLGTDNGCNSILRVYDGERPITPIISSGKEAGIQIPLTVKNGILNSMEIIFNDDGEVDVLINEAHWSDGGEIGKEW